MFKNYSGPGADGQEMTCRAGQSIDRIGLKNYRIGDIRVSPVHANFFENLGEGTADQVLELIDLIQDKIKQEFGINLEVEARLPSKEMND
jgi:UDP-N-acetylmuramate dehydrogenase